MGKAFAVIGVLILIAGVVAYFKNRKKVDRVVGNTLKDIKGGPGDQTSK